jgi:hypothetical protein
MDTQPLLGRRNLVNVAVTLWVPIPAIVWRWWHTVLQHVLACAHSLNATDGAH